nr:hypothetical protein [Citrobacter freundii]
MCRVLIGARQAGMLLCIALAAATYLILLPLDYAWFTVLGKL